MAHNTRSSSKSKDDENNNGRRSSSSDANDLKRSARKISLRTSSIPSGTRKSKRLLKRTTPTNTKRRKFERFEQPKMPSPMRRSERTKKHSPLMTEDIAHKCKTDSFRFVEYWLPVQISRVQLEQYCSTLVSNASVLQSSSKYDPVGALRDLLISTRKCCNHPYVVDPFLQTLLTEGLQAVEYLDVGIKASGKLQALDSMLMELKKKGLRELILFQSIGGSGKDSIGDILDDFLHQRFGSDAYERVDKGVLHSKKLAALNLFNNIDSGRFVFLLKAYACVPSIKLSSVDIIIIFNSDWNPMNDIKSLQRITLDSQSEQIKIFRLYSCFTVEEKALILAKQGKTLDSNLKNISWSISHTMLMWGSPCLFDNLRLIHDGKSSSSCSNYSFEDSGQLSKEALNEFSSILLQDSGHNDTSNCSIILKLHLNEGTYCTNFALLGEKKLGSPDEGLPHVFWTELLKGKVPQWKRSCGSSQRTRQRAHKVGGSINTPNFESEAITRKRREVIDNVVDEPPSNFQGEKSSTGNEEGDKATYEKRRKLCDEQKSLHVLLMPEIAKLCEILLLPDNVKTVVDNFLEYIMNNHHISRESESILQAFQISLCWTAASLLKHKINHKVSLMLAREHLKFDCRKEEADYMYSMLRCLKKIFLYRAGNSNGIGFPGPCESPSEVYSCTRVAPAVELAMKDIAKSIEEIQKKFQKKLRKLLLKQDEEKNKLNEVNEEKKAVFRGKYKIELAVIHCCFSNDAMRSEKIKILDKEFAKRIEDLECQHGILLKDLEAVQLEARQKFQRWKAAWIEEVKYWAQDELKISLSKEFGSGLKWSKNSDQAQPHDGSKNVGTASDHVDEGSIPASYGGSISRNDGHNKAESVSESRGNIISILSYSKEYNSNEATDGAYESDSQNNSSYSCRDDIVNSVIPSSEGKICDGKTLDASIQEAAVEVHNSDRLNDGWDEVPSTSKGDFCQNVLRNPDCGFSLGSKASVSSNGMDVSLNSQLSPDPIPSATAVCTPNFDNAVQIHEASESSGMDASLDSQLSPVPIPSATAVCMPNCDNAVQIHEDRTTDVATGILLGREVPIGTIGTVFLTDSPKNAIPPKPPSSIEQRFDEGASNVSDGELLLGPFGTASPSHGSDIIYDNNSLSPEQQTLGEIPTEVLENGHGVNECCNDKENQTDVIMLNNIASSAQQEGISRTINEDSVLQKIPVSCSQSDQPLVISSPVVAVNEDFCTSLFTSNKIADEDVRVGEVQNSSQQAERLSSPVDDVAIQSNPESLVTETTVQVQQLSSAKFPFSSQDATETMQNASQQAESVSTPFSTVPITQTNPDSLLVNSLEQVQILHSAEFPLSNQDLAEEVQNFSQEVEPLSNPVDVVLPNQSNSESLVTEPLMQEQQSPTSESPSSNQDTVEEMHNPSQQDGQVMANQDRVKGLLSVQHPSSNENTAEELQSSSQQIGSVCCPVDYTPHARANSKALVMEPLKHAQQLATVELPSSNLHRAFLPLAPTAEDQRINEVTVSSQVPQAIDEVPNQVVMQLDSTTPPGGRTHFSNTINRSTPEISSQPIQTATQSASRMPPPLYVDPLEIEMEKIRKETYQAVGDHENVKQQLKSDHEKELKEIVRKYNMKLQEMGVEYQQKKRNLDANINKTLAKMKLAEAIRSKCWGPKLIGAVRMPKGMLIAHFFLTDEFVQLHGEQSAVRSSLVVASSSCVTPATTLQSGFAMARSQLVATPIQSSCGTTGNFSNVSARPPQVVGNMHALAPCHQLYRSLTSMSTTSHPTPLRGMSNRLVPSTIPAPPFSFPHISSQPTPPTYQLDPRNSGQWPFNFYGLNNLMGSANQFGLNLPNVRPHM